MTADGDVVDLLIRRRRRPDPDGRPPTRDELRVMIEAAVNVPDHGNLTPWRFVAVQGEARHLMSDALASGLIESKGHDLAEAVLQRMRTKAFAGPCLVVLIASPDLSSNVPVWEQVASAAAAGYALVLAANALGLAAVWKSASVLSSTPLRALMKARNHELLLGWVVVGSERGDDELRRVTIEGSVTEGFLTELSSDVV